VLADDVTSGGGGNSSLIESMIVSANNGRAKLYMTLGLSGSGKSTWAMEQVLSRPPGAMVRIGKDSLRHSCHGGRVAGRTTEIQIERLRDVMIEAMLRMGVDVVNDDCNLFVGHEERMRQIAKDCGAEFILKDFTYVTVDECIARDARRPGHSHVGREVILREARDLARRPRYSSGE
jgi:predicted kinase